MDRLDEVCARPLPDPEGFWADQVALAHASHGRITLKGEARLDLQALGNLGEAIAAIGVIISLVYLAVQVRQNTRSIRAATYQGVLESSRAILNDFYAGPDVREFFLRAGKSLEGLTEDDRLRLHTMGLVAFRHMDNALYQQRVGTLAPDLWEGYARAFAGWLRYPGFAGWYLENQASFSPQLRAWVGEALTDIDNEPSGSVARGDRPLHM
jgi:hypothetical protein